MSENELDEVTQGANLDARALAIRLRHIAATLGVSVDLFYAHGEPQPASEPLTREQETAELLAAYFDIADVKIRLRFLRLLQGMPRNQRP